MPTLRDRAGQALAKLALEPEWEAQFEPNSYGFRPGRSCQDAIEAVFCDIRRQPKYVLDADIMGCFDHINHHALLAKLGTFPRLRRAIQAWLKAGVLEAGQWLPTNKGTPQGGVLSPLLANIALHGLETALTTAFRPKEGPTYLVRYADDFVVFHATEQGIHKARQVVEEWLRGLGLTLHPRKTQITHTRDPYQGRVGFDFLGFQIRQYPVGKCHTGRAAPGKPLGYKTRIAPSAEALRQHRRELARIVDAHRAAPQAALIAQMNLVIRGWTNYYRASAASYHAFRRCRDQLYAPLWRWARRQHPAKSAGWVMAKYWSKKRGTGWQFQAPDGTLLWKHSRTQLKRHVKVRGTASPFDGNLVYWAQRLRNAPLTRNRVSYLLRLQQGKCALCGLYLREDDVLEIDHLVPVALGGRDVVLNMQVLHRHCHDQKTAQDGSSARTSCGTHDKGRSAEEPDEAKASRPVLKTSHVGDDTA